MTRVVVLGRGGAGKSTLAARLGAILDLPVVELDEHFWGPDLAPTPKDEWARKQRLLTGGSRWVLDGDLGPYDVLPARLRAVDTVIVLDFPLWLCASRAVRRSRANLDFWRWVLTYRRRSLPAVRAAITEHADQAQVHVLRTQREVDELLRRAAGGAPSR